jgi:Raf kinase inhibitor-like YbhB/YbcL family protein
MGDRMRVTGRAAISTTVAIVVLTMASVQPLAQDGQRQAGDQMVQKTMLAVSSTAFEEGGRIPVKYTGDGDDLSPALNWPEAPEGISEFAVICDDPDAPGGTFTHWVIYGVPGKSNGLQEGILPLQELDDQSMQGKNSFGTIGYKGPAPPKGKPHRYQFHVYGLDVRMDLPTGISKQELLKAMKGHIVAEGELTGIYSR